MAKAVRKKTTKSNNLDLLAAQDAVAKADKLSLEDLVKGLGQLQTGVQGTLADLSVQMMAKLEELRMLSLAIEEKERQFTELTEKQSAAVALDDLNATVESTRATWLLETEERTARWAREDEEREAANARNLELAQVMYEQRRKQHEAEHDTLVKQNAFAEAQRRRELEAGWATREAALAARESEIKALEAQVAGFPAQLKLEVDNAVRAATGALAQQHKHEVAIAKADADGERRLLSSQLAALRENIEKETALRQAAEERAKHAEAQATALATAAIGRQAAEAKAEAVGAVAASVASGNKKS